MGMGFLQTSYLKLSQLPSAWDFSTYVLITLNIKYIF